jgi:hypothetical protein
MCFKKQRPYIMLLKPTLNLDFQFIQVNMHKDMKGKLVVIKITALYENRLLIKEPKWKNFQELPPWIPPVCHEFYISLLHTGQRQTETTNVSTG